MTRAKFKMFPLTAISIYRPEPLRPGLFFYPAVFPLAFAQIDSSHSSIQSRRYHMRPLQLVQRGPVP